MHTLLALQISLGGLPVSTAQVEMEESIFWNVGDGMVGPAQEFCCCALHGVGPPAELLQV